MAAKKIDYSEMPITLLGTGAGAIAPLYVANKLMPNTNPLIISAVSIAAGLFLPAMMPKNKIVEKVGSGLIAAGEILAVRKFAPGIAGIAGVDEDNATVNADPSHEQITNEYLMSGLGYSPEDKNDGMGSAEGEESENVSGTKEDGGLA